jgi:hypothetical protein
MVVYIGKIPFCILLEVHRTIEQSLVTLFCTLVVQRIVAAWQHIEQNQSKQPKQ